MCYAYRKFCFWSELLWEVQIPQNLIGELDGWFHVSYKNLLLICFHCMIGFLEKCIIHDCVCSPCAININIYDEIVIRLWWAMITFDWLECWFVCMYFFLFADWTNNFCVCNRVIYMIDCMIILCLLIPFDDLILSWLWVLVEK